jgi:hypothetical protein
MTISDVRRINAENGYYFFEKDTMRFFGTRIVSELYKNNTFITSDYTGFERDKRAYSVRVFDPKTGSVDTAKFPNGVSTFNKFVSIHDAREFARNFKE